MRVRCPHCRSLVGVTADTELSNIKCPSCEKHFALEIEETANFDSARIDSHNVRSAPATIGPFELLKHLGSGAMGEVWKARDTNVDRVVAVKFPRHTEAVSPSAEAFRREASVAGRLDHPNIVRVLDVGLEDGQFYIVSEYIEGAQLDKYCLERQISAPEAVAICAHVARALNHAHECGVIHRDLNPRNIIVDVAGHPHILDFGLATSSNQTTEALEGLIQGTPAYMSPEQARGESYSADQRVDVYSLGVILYELLTGERPFSGDGRNLLYQIVHDDPRPPRSLAKDLPGELEEICLKCLAKDPRHRYPSARELADELDRFLSREADVSEPLRADVDIMKVQEEVARLAALNQSLQRELRERNSVFITTNAEHQLYQSLVESLPLCVFRKDLEGRFVFANDFFCTTVSRQLEEVKGRIGRDVFSEQIAKKQQLDDAKVIATGNVVESIEEHLSDSGVATYFEVLKSPVRNFKGEIVGVQGLMWDVSAHTHAERALRDAKEAAEAANRAKSDFLANMSHEIRTPMTAIVGMTDVLLQRQQDDGDRKLMQMVQQSAESLRVIIDDILDFSKIEAGRFDLQNVEFDIHESVNDAVSSLSILARSKGIAVGFRIDDDVPRWVLGDPIRVRQILLNLVGNAIKFTERGQVFVEAERNCATEAQGEAAIQGGRQDNSVIGIHFAVSDTGAGVPDDKRAVIFAPFEQADSSITRRYGGTGLGLAVSSRLIGMMGGRIWLESDVGRGSVFHFVVNLQIGSAPNPAQSLDPEPVHSEYIESGDSDPLKVLLVEDHPINQEFVVHALAGTGHKVTTANNGQEALDALDRHDFDVILMDVALPVMDGLRATTEIRKREAVFGGRVPIIAMTAHAMAGDRERCLAAGMDGYITKPIKVQELLNQLVNRVKEYTDCSEVATKKARLTEISPIFDQQKLLERVGGDLAFLQRTIGMFREDYPRERRNIQLAIDESDSQSLVNSAHRLKGLIRNFNASAAGAAAERLESLGKQRDFAGASQAWLELQREVSRLQRGLDDFAST